MPRVVVIGGRGFFGAAAADALRREGLQVLVAARRPPADLQVDAEDAASIRAALAPGDVVIDAAGPFQRRSTTLVETCLSVGCDVIDLADSLDYVVSVQQVCRRMQGARSRVLTACSAVSAVSSSLVRLAGCGAPVRVSGFLAPATRHTSNPATARSFFSAVDRGVRLLRGGSLVGRRAFSEARAFAFPPPVGDVSAWLAESADAVLLPLVWPTLRDVDFWVDTRRRALASLFGAAARRPWLSSVVEAFEPLGRPLAKMTGARSGGFGVEVEDTSGRRIAAGFVHPSHSYLVAVAPAVVAARRLARGDADPSGLLPPDRHVDPLELREWLERAGVSYFSGEVPDGRSPNFR